MIDDRLSKLFDIFKKIPWKSPNLYPRAPVVRLVIFLSWLHSIHKLKSRVKVFYRLNSKDSKRIKKCNTKFGIFSSIFDHLVQIWDTKVIQNIFFHPNSFIYMFSETTRALKPFFFWFFSCLIFFKICPIILHNSWHLVIISLRIHKTKIHVCMPLEINQLRPPFMCKLNTGSSSSYVKPPF